jgi:hypothetical protein
MSALRKAPVPSPTLLALASVALAATLAGCAPNVDAAEPTPPSAPTAPSTSAPAPSPVDTLDSDGRASGTAAAQHALTAFLRPDVPYDLWWAELQPLLTPQATFAYEYTDPASIPAATITGEPVVSAAPTGTHVNVLIPTTAGQYLLVLYRENRDAGWAVDRLTPPAQSAP